MTHRKLAFTSGERRAIVLASMPRATVSERLRGTLKLLIKEWGHGAQAALVKFSATRPGGAKISAQNLSYFLHPESNPDRKTPLDFDDLDDIANFFRMSVAELFDLKLAELSGTEQRVLFGFRALPDITQEHFIALLESASVASGFVRLQKNLLRDPKKLINSSSPHTSGPIYEPTIGEGDHGISADIVGQISAIAVQLDQLARQLARLATNPPGDQPPASSGSDESLRR